MSLSWYVVGILLGEGYKKPLKKKKKTATVRTTPREKIRVLEEGEGFLAFMHHISSGAERPEISQHWFPPTASQQLADYKPVRGGGAMAEGNALKYIPWETCHLRLSDLHTQWWMFKPFFSVFRWRNKIIAGNDICENGRALQFD